MRSPIPGSSPVMPPKYHLMCTWPLVRVATSRAKALSSRAQAVPSGAMVPMRSVTSSPRAATPSDEQRACSSEGAPRRMAPSVYQNHSVRMSANDRSPDLHSSA